MKTLGNPVPIESVYAETLEDMVVGSHFHNCHEIVFIESGKSIFKICGRSYEAGPGSVVFISNFEHHEVRVVGQPYKRHYLLIRPDYLHDITNDPVILSIFKYRPGSFRHIIDLTTEDILIAAQAMDCIHKELIEKRDFWEDAVKFRLSLFLIHLLRNYRQYFHVESAHKPAALILEVQKFIENHCTEDIKLKDIAKKFYTNMYYISHLFKKTTGYTFKEYLILQRVARAKILLVNTDDPVTAVCMNSGFSNINHFIRMFRQITGITPLQFRTRLRG